MPGRLSYRRPSRLESLESRRLLAFDPSPLEQELLLLVNRMRTDPQAEFGRLIDNISPIHSPDPDVNSTLQFFHVDGPTLRSQWNSLTPVQPLAWNEALTSAAQGHNDKMIAALTQSHQLPGEASLGTRITNAGYSWNAVAENIFCYAKSPLYAHAGFAIDWGGGSTGIQSPPGHRINIMNSSYREAGFVVDEFNQGGFGPLVVTQDFGNRFSFGNAFVVGAVWNDNNDSGWYNAGEGLGGVTIQFTKTGSTPINVTAMSAGGFQVQLPAGTYTARAFGGSLPFELIANNVVVGGSNVMLNFVVPDGSPPVATNDLGFKVRNVATTIDVRANDSDPDGALATTTMEIVSAPAQSITTLNQATGTITFTPPPNFVGAAEVTYRLRDAQGFISNTAIAKFVVAHEAHPRQNPVLALDVDFDGLITPSDALFIINELNSGGPRGLGAYTPGQALLPFWDVSGDNTLTPLDAAEVVNYLNSGTNAESEPASAPQAIETAFASTAWAWWWWQWDEHDASPDVESSSTS